MNTYHYTYLITNLQPQSDQKYYIGVRTSAVHPSHDLSYMGSSKQLKTLVNESPDNFKKEILKIWSSRPLAETHEESLHKQYNVAVNPEYYNKRNANSQFHTTPESNAKISKTMSSADWINTTGRKRTAKMMETRNANGYAVTKSRAAEKRKNTIDDPAWKETTGRLQYNNQKQQLIIQNGKRTTHLYVHIAVDQLKVK